MIGAAPTGSGKTLAFALPVLQQLLDKEAAVDEFGERVALRALVVTPTRELALQVRVVSAAHTQRHAALTHAPRRRAD